MKWPYWTRTRPGQPDDCETIDLLLSLYADGMASAEEGHRVAAHLLDCADCRESLQWMQATQRALSARPVMMPPADLHVRIAAAIAASSAAPTPTSFQTRPARAFALRPALAAAASLSILGVVGYSLWHPQTPPAPTGVKSPAQIAVVPSVGPATPNVAPLSTKPLSKHDAPVAVHTMPTDTVHLAASSTDNGVEEDTISSSDTTSSSSGSKTAVTPKRALSSLPLRSHLTVIKKPTKAAVNPALMARNTTTLPTEGSKTPLVMPEDKKPDTVVAVVPKPAPPVAVTVAPTVVQQDPAPAQVASSGGEAHLRNADLLGSVKVHLGEMQRFVHSTGGNSIKGVVYATHTVDPDKTAYVPGIYSP